MLYLFFDQQKLKLLLLKKSVMGQYEVFLFDKQYQVELLKSGKIINSDLIASAVKEALNNYKSNFNERDVCLILPQESFSFFRTSIPADIASSALYSFIKDKTRAQWQANLDDYFFDYLVTESDNQSIVNLFAIEKTVFSQFQEAFSLINQRIVNILPETLTYFKLFEKTLRKDKLEKILYAIYENDRLSGYLYDSGGLINANKWSTNLPQDSTVEEVLKEQVADFEKNGQKLSRLIISGQSSEKIRQDTFTKAIGLWTNPLKRIISGFYQDYLKQLVTPGSKPFSILKFDACFGAFIFSVENKQFSLLKRSARMRLWSPKKISLPQLKIPLKEIVIFIVSFALSFLTFIFISKSKINFSFFNNLTKINPLTKSVTPTPTPTLTPTPTPAYKKENLKVKILNGSGVAGKASELKTILADHGWGEMLTGNADNYDYEKTVVQVKKNRSQAATWIKDDLKNTLTDLKIETLNADEAADLVLIIGKDFE